MEIKKLKVGLSDRSYEILIGDSLCNRFTGLFDLVLKDCAHAVIIADQNVSQLGEQIGRQLEGSGRRTSQVQIPSGEQSKCVDCLRDIWERLLKERTDRGSAVIAIGGGVVGDLAGFAAASFARGIALVQVPTTLLSQVDSSVGGKTGINLPQAKNIVGAFWQPKLVVIDTQTLTTLPQREYVSGLAEVVKYGVILIPELFEFLERNVSRVLERESGVLTEIISQSCRAKAQVVQEDERETTGLRAILNYGHTFAHAIEATSGYGSLLHGEAVAIGMHCAAHLAKLLGRVDKQWISRQAKLLQELDLPVTLSNPDADVLWEAMQHDKKVLNSSLRFVLPCQELGKVELVSGIRRDQVVEAINSAFESA